MNKSVLVLFVSVTAALSINSYGGESLTAEKRDDTKKLLQVTGGLKVGQAMSEAVVKQMSEAIKKARPDIPPQIFEVLADEVNKTIAEEMSVKGGLIDLMVLLYHKYFTHDEIKELLAFYQTPLGKKAGSLAPVMSQEGLVIGQRWGESLGPKIAERIKARFKQEGIQM